MNNRRGLCVVFKTAVFRLPGVDLAIESLTPSTRRRWKQIWHVGIGATILEWHVAPNYLLPSVHAVVGQPSRKPFTKMSSEDNYVHIVLFLR
jgi:hypothetical protein